MVCIKCGNQISDKMKFCSACGAPVVNIPHMLYCAKCGIQIPNDSSFCGECGTPIGYNNIVNNNWQGQQSNNYNSRNDSNRHCEQAYASNAGTLQSNYTTVKKNNTKRNILVGGISVVFIACVFLIFSGNFNLPIGRLNNVNDARLIKKITYNNDGSIKTYTEYEYDIQDNKRKAIIYNGNDMMKNGWTEEQYDNNYNTVKESSYNSDGIITKEIEYDNHHVIKHVNYDIDGNILYYETSEFEYDNSNNPIKQTITLTTNGNTQKNIYYITNEYDYKNNLKKQSYYNDDDHIIREIYYNSIGDNEKIIFFTNNEIHYWIDFEYNSDNKPSKLSYYNKNGEIWYWIEYIYE